MTEVADFSHERLASIRTAACQLLNSGVLFIHERTHVTEIIARLDAAAHLKHERAAYEAERKAGPRQTTRKAARQRRGPPGAVVGRRARPSPSYYGTRLAAA